MGRKSRRGTDEELKSFIRSLGLAIAYCRKQRGMSRAELAKKINISLSHLSHIEANNSDCPCRPSISLLFDVVAMLGLEMSDFLSYVQDIEDGTLQT